MDHQEGEGEGAKPQVLPPHVLIFPLQAQAHVNSMLKLADFLSLAGVHVTFMVSDRTHHLLLRHGHTHSRFSRYPGFRFQTISDGIPTDGVSSGTDHAKELLTSLKTKVKPLFRDLLINSNRLSSETRRPVTCIIADGMFSFILDLGEEMGIPVLYFRTISACCFWTYFCIPKLIESGEFPFNGDDLDVTIENVPGMEGALRRRDLPHLGDMSSSGFNEFISETRQSIRAHGLILNTFEDLEGPVLDQIRTEMPNLYTIGPLHAHLKARNSTDTTPSSTTVSSNSFWEVDRSSLTWLDKQPLKSVLYVSFGSFTIITREQLMEFWHGLVNSGTRFLWAIRPDLVAEKNGESDIPAELREGTEERGYIVGWTPQEEVLAHSSVSGFLTHSGWNSTLESLVEGVPMICWPYFADQPVNSRFVGEVWRVGLDMKDTCDRLVIEKMIRDLMMEAKENELVKSVNQMAKLAKNAISESGSSYRNLDRLVEDIRLMSLRSPN